MQTSATNFFATKLASYAPLSAQDRQALERLCAEHARRFDGEVAGAGDPPHCAHVVLSGWACRIRQLRDERRQIVALLLPGDLCGSEALTLREMDHSLATLGPATLAAVPPDALRQLVDDHPCVGKALWRDTLTAAAIGREWTLSLGRRDATSRVAHLVCELIYRLRLIGLAEGNGFEFPMTQKELAQATGMTAVHANRTLQGLRAGGLVLSKGRRITVPDLPALQSVALFSPAYLQIGQRADAERNE